MKKSRKLLALVMAMLMAFSLMAMTAAAYDEGHEHNCTVCSEEEGIMPLGDPGPLGPPCPVCGRSMTRTIVGYDKNNNPIYDYYCNSTHL